MSVLRNVVVPVDFESTSYQAVRYARDLACAFGARVHLLHVLEDTFALRAGTEGTLSAFPHLAQRAEEEARERLSDLLSADDRKESVIAVTISSSPAAAIVTYAEQHQASAIVMGTHGRIAKPVDAIGSVAEQVVRTAPCPVLTLRRHPQDPGAREVTAASLPAAAIKAT
jgi:nucleotide-binding universal stress UspA family protein